MDNVQPARAGSRRSRLRAFRAVALVCVVVALGFYGNDQGWFDSVPQKCGDITKAQLRRVWEDIPLIKEMGKLTGNRLLEIVSATDTGSTDPSHLKCAMRVLTSIDGEQMLNVTTTTVNGNAYLQVSLPPREPQHH
jgi:hypothetical protein